MARAALPAGTPFGIWLRQRRKALDLTQEQLAATIDVSLPTIVKIEAGQRRPSRQVAELLARWPGGAARGAGGLHADSPGALAGC